MSEKDTNRKIRVLVVDDSLLMSRQIAGILEEDPEIEVVGRAQDGVEALKLVEELTPDVVTLDVEMPRMDGLTALKNIMVRYAVPTVMISALTKEGAKTTFDALKYGAIDVISKPSRKESVSLDYQKKDIVNKVKRASEIRTGKSRYIRMSAANPGWAKESPTPADGDTRIIGIAAGTGGYYPFLKIIPSLSQEFKDVIVGVILVSSRYVEPFAAYLSTHSAVPVKSAINGDRLVKGMCYICSGYDGPLLEKEVDGSVRFRFARSEGTTISRPIDDLFTTIADVGGSRSLAIILSGAGSDGADGVHAVRRAGGKGAVQEITNCMDPTMPLAVLQKGSVEKILPDFTFADFIMKPDGISKPD